MVRDFRNALRRIQKYPIMCVVAIVSLAAGIGATTAMLTIRNAMFRNPPPLSPNPRELFEAFMPTVERAYTPKCSTVSSLSGPEKHEWLRELPRQGPPSTETSARQMGRQWRLYEQ